MRVSKVAVYTLAVFSAQELSHKAGATSSITLKESEVSDVLAVSDATPETAKVKNTTEAIAPPETLEIQPFAAVLEQSEPLKVRTLQSSVLPAETQFHSSVESDTGEKESGDAWSLYQDEKVTKGGETEQGDKATQEQGEVSKNVIQPLQISPSSHRISQLSATSYDNFTRYRDRIQKSLPPGLIMRLPSFGESENRVESGNQYFVNVLPLTSEPSLTISIFTCENQQPSCLVGSVAVAAKTSIAAQSEFKRHQASATAITLANTIRGYLLEGQKQKSMASFSSIMWEQDNQFYTVRLPVQSRLNLVNIASSTASAIPIQSTTTVRELSSNHSITVTAPEKSQEEGQIASFSSSSETRSTAELLQNRHPILTTAEQLRQGEIVTNFHYRQTFPEGTSGSVGLTGQPTFGISWGITNNLELTLDAQTVDNSGPVNQGPFLAQRINPDGTGPNFFQEITLQAKQRIWQNESGTQALSGVVAASLGNAGRPYRFYQATGPVANGQNDGIVTSLELPFTVKPSDRLQFTLSPKVAFFPENNALYFNTAPINNPGSFGTTFGLAGGISYQLSPRLIVWGDTFVPFSGNNTINRDTGLPARTVAFNTGLRYIVNPRLATDLFVSNTLGNTGPLSIVADKDNIALGFGVTYLPGITGANRRYSQHFGSTQQPSPDTSAGFGLLDGGTIPNQQLRLSLQGGEQGLLTGVRYGLLDDFEIGTFLESIPGTVDESALGFSGKIRFLHQADGDPFTLSALVTAARSNNVMINLINNNRNEFEERGLEKGGFAFSNEKNGELFILTLSAPMHYQFKGGSAIWLTPTLGFIQRNGLQVAGFNLGGSVPITRDLDAIAEAGLELTGKGNAFIGNSRETVIPWSVGLRWRPASLLGISENSAISGLQLEAYVTNRLGTTPFGSLRVRADNDIAIGAGLVLPIQF